MTRTIGDEVEYDGEPGTKGTVVEYTENGDWVTVDWQIAPKARGNDGDLTYNDGDLTYHGEKATTLDSRQTHAGKT